LELNRTRLDLSIVNSDLNEDVPTPQRRESFVKAYPVDVNSFCAPEGAHSLSWPNGLIIFIINIDIVIKSFKLTHLLYDAEQPEECSILEQSKQTINRCDEHKL
jgi:hypothetical protein